MSDDASGDSTLPTIGQSTDPVPRASDPEIDSRYVLGAMLGRGGMGEVRLARDLRINEREVAVKLMHAGTDSAELAQRFLREAYVQGHLEHPAVPPVHDLGRDREGRPFFVKKKLAGTTLDAAFKTLPRRKLLSRLVEVCLAVEFAHTRGIVHRDLKPANIMLGDFGETYVLDWGLARVAHHEIGSVPPLVGAAAEAGQTAAGALLGTPGYMAPEQARGDAIDARADVFALGCILYEILAGEPALPRGMAAIAATLEADRHRPSERAADVPPELDALCARATAQDRAQRPTARELADGIQAYLDGDRDVEARRALAADHVRRARASLGEADTDRTRAEAMRHASRALALDQENADAQQIVARLVIEAPVRVPAGAIAEADRERSRMLQKLLRMASFTYVGLSLAIASLLLLPVRHAWPLVSSIGLAITTAIVFGVMSRRELPMRSPYYNLLLLLNAALLLTAAFIFGPLHILPLFVVGSLAGFLAAPVTLSKLALVVSHFAAVAIPIALELAGYTPSTFRIENGNVIMVPYAVELSSATAVFVFLFALAAQIASSVGIGIVTRRSSDRALDAVHAQSWHLKQLLPDAKK